MTPAETIEANRLLCEEITALMGHYEWRFDQFVNTHGNVMWNLKNLRTGQSARSNDDDHPREIAARLRAMINCGKSGLIERKDMEPFIVSI